MKNHLSARSVRGRQINRRLFLESLESRVVLTGQFPAVTIDGLSWYRAEGNANDSTGANPGALVSGAVTAPGGRVGNGFQFSVSNNRVEIPDSASLRLQTFTIDAWIFPTFVNFPDLGGEIIGKQLSVGSGDVSLSILGPNSSGAYTFAAKQPGGSPNFSSTTGFLLNQWHHVALTSDGTTVRGYVDGVQQTGSFNLALDGPISYDTSASAPPWTIGGHAGASPGFANRYQYDNTLIDEVGISQRGLSTAEVQAIYNRGALGRYAIPGGQQFTLPGVFSDSDSSSWTATVNYGDGSGTLPLTLNPDHTFTIAHTYATAGQRTITVAVTDDTSNTTTHSLLVNVTTPTNTAPTAVNDSFDATEDLELSVGVLGVLDNDTDPQNNALTAVLVDGPSHGDLSLNEDGSFTYAPWANYHGPDSFTYQASDGSLLSNVATVNLTVASVPDAPVLDPVGNQSVEEGSLLTFTASGSDADVGDSLTFSLQNAPEGASIDDQSGVFTWTPTTAQGPGTYNFDVIISDGSLSDSETITITVTEPPVIQLLPDPDRLGQTMVVVDGSAGADTLVVTPTINAGEYSFVLNGLDLGAYAPTGSVQIYGSSGLNSLTLNGTSSSNVFEVHDDCLVLNSLPFYHHSATSRTVSALGSGDTISVYDGSATIDGGTASDTLAVTGGGNHNWQITAQNAGCLDGQIYFSSIERLVGSSGMDAFHLANGMGVNGTINGGGGSDTLDYAAFTTAVSVNLQSGNATKTGGILGIEQVVGGQSTDTLSGANLATTWNLTGLNCGNNGAVAFSSFENLSGGNQADLFQIQAGGGLSGVLSGGSGDSLSYASYGSPVTVNLATSTSTAIASFSSFASFIGSGGTDVFIASNTSNTWTITSATTGTVKSTSFSCFEDLRGGTAADTFRALQGTTFAGTFNGCGGVDELDYAAFTSTVEVSLLTGAATGLSGVSGIENLTGGDGNDFLVGDSANNVISGRDGDDIIFGWSGSDSLSGNGGRDFVIGGTGGDTVHGNNAEDILVAGTLVYANETTSALDRTAVDALMAEWRRTDLAYAARISHLNGTTGGGLNGIYRLNAITVVDDNEMDILHGDAGLDWFLAGAKDSVIASGNETETFT